MVWLESSAWYVIGKSRTAGRGTGVNDGEGGDCGDCGGGGRHKGKAPHSHSLMFEIHFCLGVVVGLYKYNLYCGLTCGLLRG